MNHNDSTIRDWLSRNLKCASLADEARAQLSHPRMQQLNEALKLIGEVARDQGWMLANDEDRRLDEALKILIHISTIKSK